MIEVKLVLNGKIHALRNWQAVPRVGDLLETKCDGTPIKVVVTQVIWRDQAESEYRDGITRATVNCRMEHLG